MGIEDRKTADGAGNRANQLPEDPVEASQVLLRKASGLVGEGLDSIKGSAVRVIHSVMANLSGETSASFLVDGLKNLTELYGLALSGPTGKSMNENNPDMWREIQLEWVILSAFVDGGKAQNFVIAEKLTEPS